MNTIVRHLIDRVDPNDPSTYRQHLSVDEVEAWIGDSTSINDVTEALINARIEIREGGGVTKWLVAERCQVEEENDELTVHLNPLLCQALQKQAHAD